MTDTTEQVTSDVRTCVKCESPFGGLDDKRFKDCAKCRGAVVEETPAAPAPVHDAPTLTEAGVKAIRLDVDKRKPPPPVKRDFYWCGATSDSPIHAVTLGGVSFPKNIGEVREGAPGEGQKFIDNVANGQIHQLTEANVALCMEHAANKVIRHYREETLGNNPDGDVTTVFQGDIISMSGSRMRPFTPREGDIPIGCFVYMVKVRNRSDRPFTDPPTMVERDW